MCINLLLITPHKEDASFSLNEQSKQQVIKCTLLPFCFCTVKSTQSTLHSWDVPPSPDAQTFPPVSRWWGNQRLLRGAKLGHVGVNNPLEWSRGKPLSGQTSRRWFLWQPLPVHLHNSLYTWTKQHFYMSIEGREKTLHPMTLTVAPAHEATQAGRQTDRLAGEQVRNRLPFIWWGSLLVSGRWRPPQP